MSSVAICPSCNAVLDRAIAKTYDKGKKGKTLLTKRIDLDQVVQKL